MGLALLILSFPWHRYSKKLNKKILKPRSIGSFTKEEAEARDVRLAVGYEGSFEEGNLVSFSWLVDKDDGIIIDAKFLVYGQSALIGAAEVACDLLIGKNHDQARRVTADLIDQHVRDHSDLRSFPKEAYPQLNLVLGAIEGACDQCMDIPFADSYVAPPMPANLTEIVPGGYPGWKELSLQKKISVIEQVLDQDVRPYIALDAGGVSVLNLLDDKQLLISYQGNCTSCYSSIGATLSYIQQVIRAKVHPDITVVPDVGEAFGPS